MARPASEHPTELELAILKVLWQKSPQTVQDVRDELAEAGRELANSSVITMMNIMVRKQYLKREKAGRAFEFTPLIEQQSVGECWATLSIECSTDRRVLSCSNCLNRLTSTPKNWLPSVRSSRERLAS
jgi:predicted transcriptional regulator